jgi:catechol 2,3-dioxygenase-like lactoylglutathione lyase family enzyme
MLSAGRFQVAGDEPEFWLKGSGSLERAQMKVPGTNGLPTMGGFMTEERPMMIGAATVLVVSDIARSIEHYRDTLGFAITFEYGKPTFYACLCRDEVSLHLLAARQTKRLPGNGGICVFVKDVDAVHAELAARGANVLKPPQDYDYGMRDFGVLDLDGNQLTFGMGSSSSN